MLWRKCRARRHQSALAAVRHHARLIVVNNMITQHGGSGCIGSRLLLMGIDHLPQVLVVLFHLCELLLLLRIVFRIILLLLLLLLLGLLLLWWRCMCGWWLLLLRLCDWRMLVGVRGWRVRRIR